MLKKLFKTGVTAAAGWLGNAIGGSTGRNIATKITGSLFDRNGSGGNFQLQDTSVAPQNYGGRLGFERSDKAGGTSRIKTADGEELRNEWDYRLTKWFRNKDSMFT
tara:strand:+ start:177 stop:494 length:318 start_codon:yes stop_codon:yes gene_type:complete